jgi:flavodoxin I
MRIAIIYWSGTGNTEAMAALIAEGARKSGATVDVVPISQCDGQLFYQYDRIAFGCPAAGQEELDDVEFLPYYEKLEEQLGNKSIALFGSYSWGDGEWMRLWEERVKEKNLNLFEKGLIVQEEPDNTQEECRDFGFRFASA